MKDSKQMILSVAPDWDSKKANLRRYERDKKGKWKPVDAQPFPATIGRNGLGWGIGLHDYSKVRDAKYIKHEGDGRAPAGVFRLSDTFGYENNETLKNITTRLPYHQVNLFSNCVDDADSKYYNTMVYDEKSVNKDWKSSEHLRTPDKTFKDIYKYAIVVDHNHVNKLSDQIDRSSKFGSCIFIHIWKGPEIGTAGCTAFEEKTVKDVLEWLNVQANPVFVQLPTEEYTKQKDNWCLPDFEHTRSK